MDTFRKIITALCTALFAVSSVLALFAFNIEWRAFESAAYKQAFEQQNLYERVPEIMANALYASAAENPNADPFLQALTMEDWQATITALLPPQDLKAITDSALDSLFDYVNGRSDSAVVSLMPLKSNLLGPVGMEVAGQILKAQPACTAEQLLQIGLGFVSGDVSLCNPPEEMLGLMTPLIESQVQALTFSIPDEITLLSSPLENPTADPRAKLDQARTWMKITPVFPLLFLFAVTIFGVRGLMDWLKWWGWPFLLTGATSALIATLGAPIFSLAVERLLQTQGAGFLPPILFSTARETIGVVTGQILKPVMVEGLILAAVGAVMVTTASLLVYRNRQAK